jgi:hypothetical protein
MSTRAATCPMVSARERPRETARIANLALLGRRPQ